MRRRVGWYVHHHGRGHLTRLLALAPFVEDDIVCFSSLAEPDGLPGNCRWTTLPRDDDASGHGPAAHADPTVGGLLHWAPLRHAGHRARLAEIARRLADEPVDAFVVDVSVEVALLVRLLGTPVVLIAQPGIRDDRPHHLAFEAASAILAPWPGELLMPAHLQPFADKTLFVGGISRFESRPAPAGPRSGVVVLGGAGGSTTTDDDVLAAQTVTGRPWRRLGGRTWTREPWEHIAGAGIVVAEPGQNAVADIAAAGARAIIVPQERPFDEQHETARALEAAGLAMVVPHWPAAGAWPRLLARAEELEPPWQRWRVHGAARRAADEIRRVARA